jgi:hypothetical protein
MTNPLIAGYLAGLHRQLPAPIADEAADGLTETYEHHLAAGTGEQEAARAALAEFGELELVVGEYTRQAPALAVAAAFSLSRIAFTAWALPRLTAR